VTLGTIVSGVPIFQLLLDAFADLDVDVLVTTGRQNDPAELDVPPNATVERYIPQAELLPRVSLVVTHGGSGSMLGALAHGLPLVVVPRGADQFDNAIASSDAGAARVLLPDDLTETKAREALIAVLGDASYRTAARGIADEIAAMPSAGDVAQQIAETV
jgi:MGT family glycosyltransferase